MRMRKPDNLFYWEKPEKGAAARIEPLPVK